VRFVAALIVGESLFITCAAGALGTWLIYPAAGYVGHRFGTIFPIFNVSDNTIVMALSATLLVGVVAAAGPALQASTVKVSEGFRAVG
jgi:putative ABC transport system permease protein